jgi:hypothetical protein
MHKIINDLLENVSNNETKSADLKKAFELFSSLRFCHNIDEMAHVICNWVKKHFK